jgi:hypothetical protein
LNLSFLSNAADGEEEKEAPTFNPSTVLEAKRLMVERIEEKLPHDYLRTYALDVNKEMSRIDSDCIVALLKLTNLEDRHVKGGKELKNIQHLRKNVKIDTIDSLNGTQPIELLNQQVDIAMKQANAWLVDIYCSEKKERIKVYDRVIVKTLIKTMIPLAKGLAKLVLSEKVLCNNQQAVDRIEQLQEAYGIIAVIYALQDETFLEKVAYYSNTSQEEIISTALNNKQLKHCKGMGLEKVKSPTSAEHQSNEYNHQKEAPKVTEPPTADTNEEIQTGIDDSELIAATAAAKAAHLQQRSAATAATSTERTKEKKKKRYAAAGAPVTPGTPAAKAPTGFVMAAAHLRAKQESISTPSTTNEPKPAKDATPNDNNAKKAQTWWKNRLRRQEQMKRSPVDR